MLMRIQKQTALKLLTIFLGGNPLDLPTTMDGVNQWFTLTLNLPSRPRTTVLLNIDERNRNAATRVENWKLIIGGYLNYCSILILK